MTYASTAAAMQTSMYAVSASIMGLGGEPVRDPFRRDLLILILILACSLSLDLRASATSLSQLRLLMSCSLSADHRPHGWIRWHLQPVSRSRLRLCVLASSPADGAGNRAAFRARPFARMLA